MQRGVISEAVRSNYSRLNLIWTEGLIEALTNLRQVFGNDMDKIVVLAVIGQNAQRLTPPGKSFEEVIEGVGTALPRGAVTNVQSITDSTGIPRESVRRKVGELIEAGWIERLDGGHLRIRNNSAAISLKDVTETQFAVIDRTMTAMISELEQMQVIKVISAAP